jgi:uncharacterized membrane protein
MQNLVILLLFSSFLSLTTTGAAVYVDDASEYAAQVTEDSLTIERLNREMKRAERQEKCELEKREKEIKALQFEKEMSVR